jgi:hypothetical protein
MSHAQLKVFYYLRRQCLFYGRFYNEVESGVLEKFMRLLPDSNNFCEPFSSLEVGKCREGRVKTEI